MTAWPHKGRLPAFADAEPVASPLAATRDLGSAPLVDAVSDAAGEKVEGSLPVESPPADASPEAGPRRLRRRWLVAAALLSGAAHAAAIYALVSWLDLRSVEADVDEVSVEIVIEPPEQAGLAAEEAVSDAAEDKPVDLPGFVPPDPLTPLLAEAPDFPEPAAPKMILADLPMPETLAGPPQMPPVAKLELPAPETLAILAAPPKFETIDAIAAPVQPARQEEKRAEPEARKAEPQRIAKPEPKAESGRKQPEPERKPEKKQAEKKTAEKPAKPEKPAREARKGNSAKADQKKKPDPAKADGNPAAGVAGKGSGAKDRKQGEAGKVASKASGNAAQYGALVNREVQRAFRYPVEAQRAGMKGVVRVQIRIDSSGRLTSANVRSSSGHALLDREALATVRRAAPFPKPPAGMAADSFSINLRFSR